MTEREPRRDVAPTFMLDGREFRKSTFSPLIKYINCVAVSISDQDVLVTSTQDQSQVVRFTIAEWAAFVEGVKAGQFDAG